MAVTVIRDIQSELEVNRAQLQSELSCCESSGDAYLIEQYFIEKGIYTLSQADKEEAMAYFDFLTNKGISMTKAKKFVAAYNRVQREFYAIEHAAILHEIRGCKIGKAVKNKATQFLIDNGIETLSQIDYLLREKYVAYLESHIALSKVKEYVKAFDVLKLHAIKTEEESQPLRKPQVKYKETQLYLSYYPVYDIAKCFYYIHDKSSLVWDFTLPASDKLKRQVFRVLTYSVGQVKSIEDVKDCKARYLLPLKWLYEYCVDNNIGDLEQLEKIQIEAFRGIVSSKVQNVQNSMQIVDNVRKILFLTADETNWRAAVWYLERFKLQSERMNPSNPIIRFSFLDVIDQDNRGFLQDYEKYQIGVGNQSIVSIRQEYGYIVNMLKFFDSKKLKVATATPEDLEKYFREVDIESIDPRSYNKKITSCFSFFRYLKISEKIKRNPILIEYYLKGVVPVHHDRSISFENVKKVLHSLKYFPLHLRLMYLHLWCIGLRVNEVCTLKGNAYTWRDGAAWILVYQNKMRAEKRIPIPTALYQLMIKYIEKNEIQPDEYIFKSAKGKAYHVGTFTKQFIKGLKNCGIECSDYDFRSHDYRHTVATLLYNHGASLQAIRDYLGHKNDQMTLQYLDYLPNLAEKENRDYFEKEQNKLALRFEIKKKREASNEEKNIPM